MPIKVILQNIDGTQRLDDVVDSDGTLDRCMPAGDPSFPLLQYVDPYGNAVFNRSQMPQLIEELLLLVGTSSNQETRIVLDKILALAKQCRAKPHLYLRFVGD